MIISDNASSFVSAENELKRILQDGRQNIEDFAVTHNLKWKFNTPLSPHQGGFFESMVKSSWNEMSTVFAEVECIVNSCPLGQSSNDANDLQPLTPNHLILGCATADVPQGPFKEARTQRKRFEYVQSLVQQFWSRFQREYLQTLMRPANRRNGNLRSAISCSWWRRTLVEENWNLARVI